MGPGQTKILAVLKTVLNFVLGPPPPGGPGEDPDRHFSEAIGCFWADSGPDPEGNLFLIFILALSVAALWLG